MPRPPPLSLVSRVKIIVTLRQASKLKRDNGLKGPGGQQQPPTLRRGCLSERDGCSLLRKVVECKADLPCACKVHFPDPEELPCLQLPVTLNEVPTRWDTSALQLGGSQSVMLDHDQAPWSQKVASWVCVYERTVRGTGWAPARTLQDSVWELSSFEC